MMSFAHVSFLPDDARIALLAAQDRQRELLERNRPREESQGVSCSGLVSNQGVR